MTSRLAGLQFVNPHLSTGQLSSGLASSYLTVPAGGTVPLPGTSSALDVTIAGAGRVWTLPEWTAATYGTSLVVVVGGSVVHEWYAEGCGPHDLLLGASMTKSALAHLVGLAVRAGDLRLDDRVVDHVPELAGSGYEPCTVAEVASMTSGVDWFEDHRDPTSLASRLTACFAADGGDSRALLGTVGPRHLPGTQWEYCTADSQVLDWVRERATGSPYADALAGLWSALGCTSDAVVGVDAVGVPMAGGSLAATARDWARIALLQLDGLAADGTRLLDESWLDASSAPGLGLSFLAPGRLPSSITTHAGFGLHWWPLDADGRRVTADGSRGQFAYADRDLGVVVVKTSQWPYDDWLVDRQLRDLSYLGLPEIARVAAEQPRPPAAAPIDVQEETAP